MSKLYGPYECVQPFQGMGGVQYNRGDKPIYLHRLAAQAKLQTGHIVEVGKAPRVSFSPEKPDLELRLEKQENPYVTARETKAKEKEQAKASANEATLQIVREALDANEWSLLREACKVAGISGGGNKVAVARRLRTYLDEHGGA